MVPVRRRHSDGGDGGDRLDGAGQFGGGGDRLRDRDHETRRQEVRDARRHSIGGRDVSERRRVRVVPERLSPRRMFEHSALTGGPSVVFGIRPSERRRSGDVGGSVRVR